MAWDKRGFWWKAALVTAAIMLPFGTVIAIAVAAVRSARSRRAAERQYEEWWRLRDLARAASQSHLERAGNGHPNGARRPELAVDRQRERQ